MRLREAWTMSATAAGSISTGFQLGYAVSLLCFSALADRVGARRVFLASGAASVLAALAFAFFARSYVSGLLLYTLVAISQGGTYTTAIMLFADRYPPARRGAAVGWLLATLGLGGALAAWCAYGLAPDRTRADRWRVAALPPARKSAGSRRGGLVR